MYHIWHSEYPVFVLDDVDAELDRKRIERLLGHLEGRTQTFVTTSKESLVEQYHARAAVYEIRRGEASVIPPLAVEEVPTIAATGEGI